MENKHDITVFRTQLDLSNALKDLIDNYWAFDMNEEEFISRLKRILELNDDKMFLPGRNEFTAIMNQRLGKRRVALIKTIISNDYHL